MPQVTFAFRDTSGQRSSHPVDPAFGRIFPGLRQLLADWGKQFRAVKAEAQIARALEGYDDHLLRDMGLTRLGNRIEPWGIDQNPWG
jgi:hypothetical protein